MSQNSLETKERYSSKIGNIASVNTKDIYKYKNIFVIRWEKMA